MKLFYIEQAPKEEIRKGMNKGHIAEHSAIRSTKGIKEYEDNALYYKYGCDLEHEGKKISIKSMGCQFAHLDKEKVEQAEDKTRLMESEMMHYIADDYADTYWIMFIPPNSNWVEKKPNHYAVIEIQSPFTMVKFVKDLCCWDNGKLRLKTTENRVAKWYSQNK